MFQNDPNAPSKRLRLESASNSAEIQPNENSDKETSKTVDDDASLSIKPEELAHSTVLAKNSLSSSDEIDLELYGPSVLQPSPHSFTVNEYHFEVGDFLYYSET